MGEGRGDPDERDERADSATGVGNIEYQLAANYRPRALRTRLPTLASDQASAARLINKRRSLWADLRNAASIIAECYLQSWAPLWFSTARAARAYALARGRLAASEFYSTKTRGERRFSWNKHTERKVSWKITQVTAKARANSKNQKIYRGDWWTSE